VESSPKALVWRRTDDYRLLIGTLKHGYRFYKELWSDADLGLTDVIMARMRRRQSSSAF
jgi:hypothetical protein